MMTCSATETTFEPETSSTSMPFSTAAFRSMWSEPTPAVIQIFRFFACASRDQGQSLRSRNPRPDAPYQSGRG